MSEYCLAYITCASKEEAEKILLTLLEERLVACGNISSPVTSYFHWDGNIDKAEEVVLILKTRDVLFGQVEIRVGELHSYEVPCILKLPIVALNAPYAAWMEGCLVGK